MSMTTVANDPTITTIDPNANIGDPCASRFDGFRIGVEMCSRRHLVCYIF